MDAYVRLFDCSLDASTRMVLEPLLASGMLAAGSHVSELEHRLENRFPGRSAVAVANLTQALALALRLLDIGAGDEVLVPALNCMASSSAISLAGATPAWVDIHPATLTIDLADCDYALTSRTKALMAYYVAGYPGDIAAIERFCRDRGLALIEDANNALGACSAGRLAGMTGRFSILSFYANRQINGIDGAALLCADPSDAQRARRLRRFGVDMACFRDADGEIATDTDVVEIGLPASMTNMNARIACHQFDTLDDRLAAVRDNAVFLRSALAGTSIVSVPWRAVDDPAFWVFLVRCAQRDGLMRYLKAHGVQCSRLHQRNDRYSGFGVPARELPGTAQFENEILALPVGWWISSDQRNHMRNVLRDWRPDRE